MKTIINIELPLQRVPAWDKEFRRLLPPTKRWFGWLFQVTRASVSDFDGTGRVNTVHHFNLFRWPVLSIHRNQYHDASDKERADEYLSKWSECEKELRGLRLIMLGDETAAEVKKVIRDSLGVDLDEGTIR